MTTLESTAAKTLVEALAPAGRRPAVEVAHLRKAYGSLVAVDDVSFTVTEGEIFGILGPNGAGKTTAIECAIGLRRPDAGTIRLLGLDPHADQEQVHEIVGVQLQSGALPAKLRVGEILEEYRSFYRDPADIDELLDVLGLSAKRGDYYRSLSGGQRQRLSVALALIGRPRLAFLDEMTTGLDPQARRDTWELIEQIRGRGVTIVLVTHFAFGAADPKSPAGLALSSLLAIAGLFALGLLVAAVAPTSGSVNAIGRLAIIPLLFFAGLWLPRALMPAVLQDISTAPLGAAVEAIQDSMQTGFPPARPLLVLVAYAVVFAFLARRFFRWE